MPGTARKPNSEYAMKTSKAIRPARWRRGVSRRASAGGRRSSMAGGNMDIPWQSAGFGGRGV